MEEMCVNFVDKIEYKEMMLKYNFAKKKLETELDILLQEYAFTAEYNPVEHIKSRIKSLDRIIQKLNRKGQKITVENITRYVSDVVGMRIVCSFISDVYTIVNIIRATDEFIVKAERDYIKKPKQSGYMSYHMQVLVPIHLENRTEFIGAEIQIRTVAMDCWASLDHKLIYKLPKKVPDMIRHELVATATDMMKIDMKMQRISDIINNI